MTYLQNERTKGNKTSSLIVVSYLYPEECSLCYENNKDCPNWQGVHKILTKMEPKSTTNVTTKIRFFFTKHRENLQAYKKSYCPKRTENFVRRLRLQESVVVIVFVSLQQSSVLDVIIF